MKKCLLLGALLMAACPMLPVQAGGAHRMRGAGVGSTDVAAVSPMGSPRIPVILVNYQDVQLMSSDPAATWTTTFAAEEGVSVRRYFADQSMGKFDPQFELHGPYTLSCSRAYYGANNANGNDGRVDEMVKEACTLAAADVDFGQYDNNGDGAADVVIVLYAGRGEANSEDADAADYVWPGAGRLADGAGDTSLSVNGVTIDNFAVFNELSSLYDGREDGIGTICHELSHCLGLPDWYDTTGGNHYGMGSWSVMDFGCYNNALYTPCGYTAYERAFMGWMEIEELTDSGRYTLAPVADGGKAYRISSATANEYYIVENRQRTGWDAYLPAAGLMVTHVKYDAERWQANTVNNYADKGMSIIAADNSLAMKEVNGVYSANLDDELGDLFPYNGCDSLTDNGTPAALLYSGTGRMGKPLTQITQEADGTVSFVFSPRNSASTTVAGGGETIFYESFDQCSGKGGNDGKWSGNIATSKFRPDISGWSSAEGYKFKAYGASQCARFGTTVVLPVVLSPAFTVSGVDTLTFKAAGWGSTETRLFVTVEGSDVDISENVFDLPNGEWGTFTAVLTGSGTIRLCFRTETTTPLFLDEVTVCAPLTTRIAETPSRVAPPRPAGIYTIDGRRMGNEASSLPAGIYVSNGRKWQK